MAPRAAPHAEFAFGRASIWDAPEIAKYKTAHQFCLRREYHGSSSSSNSNNINNSSSNLRTVKSVKVDQAAPVGDSRYSDPAMTDSARSEVDS